MKELGRYGARRHGYITLPGRFGRGRGNDGLSKLSSSCRTCSLHQVGARGRQVEVDRVSRQIVPLLLSTAAARTAACSEAQLPL